ncbi:hypothetical protein WI460_17095 [Gemmatimonadota bacterium Y43]|uniref:ATP-grasp domain-containing protein n=1 Tax=Gaopeijia maritima TaxID=3119007 RepID=UPI003283926F
MADVTRRIGLSLGADICWPIAFTEILKRLDLAVPVGGDTVRFEVERMTIDPFDLREPKRYDVVVDRLTHWYHTRREWIKKAVLMDDVYVFNNPWTVQSVEKLSAYAGMIRLGFPIPKTWLVPPHAYEPSDDLDYTLRTYARHFDLGAIGSELGYPMYMKPYDGGGWRAVSRIHDEPALRATYDDSGKLVMTLQESIEPHDHFVRCIGLGPQTRLVRYDAGAPHHDRYTDSSPDDYLSADDRAVIEGTTLIINAFFGWDFNSCELLHRSGAEGGGADGGGGADAGGGAAAGGDSGAGSSADAWVPIDFANPCPDSQVTSIHYHFPWVIEANLRWALFAAATGRRVKRVDWDSFIARVEPEMTLRERIDALLPLVHERFDTPAFDDFCGEHLSHLHEVTHGWFGTDAARDAVRQKVVAVFPEHEVDEFTDLFFSRLQQWRDRNPVEGA